MQRLRLTHIYSQQHFCLLIIIVTIILKYFLMRTNLSFTILIILCFGQSIFTFSFLLPENIPESSTAYTHDANGLEKIFKLGF